MAEVIARGLRFHIQRLGWDKPDTAPTVVFLHGLIMDNLSSWYFTSATAAARTARVLLVDLRGHGRSERPESGYDVASMIEDVEHVLTACGVDTPVLVVGNSFGGLLGIGLALKAPARVMGLVLVEAHLSEEGFGAGMADTLTLQGEERDRAIADNFAHWLGRHSQRKATKLATNAKALVYGTSLVSDLRNSPPFSKDSLRELSVPTLALYGEHSDIRERGTTLATLLPHCELIEFPGCTHSILWEATEDVTTSILEFISRYEQSGAN